MGSLKTVSNHQNQPAFSKINSNNPINEILKHLQKKKPEQSNRVNNSIWLLWENKNIECWNPIRTANFFASHLFSLGNQTIHNCTKIERERERDRRITRMRLLHSHMAERERVRKKDFLYFLRGNLLKDQSCNISGYVLVWALRGIEIKKPARIV